MGSATESALDVACEDAEALLAEVPLDTVSLRDVYATACTRWRVAPNRHVVDALPAALGGYEVVDALDFSGCYVGRVGWAPLLPVIICSERLKSLSVAGIGLRPREVAVLLEAAAAHPSLAHLDLSRNEVGTVCGQQLLKAAKRNQRLTSVVVDDALVIPALQSKLVRQVEANKGVQDELPLRVLRYIKTRVDGEGPTEQDVQDELRRREEREAARRALLEQLPYWVPAAMEELTELLDAHKAHLADLHTMFDGRAVTAEEFRRVMKAVGVRFPLGGTPKEQRELTLAKLLGCLEGPAGGSSGGTPEGGGGTAGIGAMIVVPERQPAASGALIEAGAGIDGAGAGALVPSTNANAVGRAVLEFPTSQHRIDHAKLVALLRVPTMLLDREAAVAGDAGPPPTGTAADPKEGEGVAADTGADPGAPWWDPPKEPSYKPSAAAQAVMNFLYDNREGLAETLQMIETASGIGVVTLDEFLAGFAALDVVAATGVLAEDEKAAALGEILRAAEVVSEEDLQRHAAAPVDEPIAILLDFRKVFARLRPGRARTVRWDKMTTSGLKAFLQPETGGTTEPAGRAVGAAP